MYPKTSNRVHISLDMHPKSQNWVHVIYTLLYNPYLEQSHNKQDNKHSQHPHCPAAQVHFPPLPLGKLLFHWVRYTNAVSLHDSICLDMINVSKPLTPMRLGQIHTITFCSNEHAVTKVHAVPPLHCVHPHFIKCVILGYWHKLNGFAACQANDYNAYEYKFFHIKVQTSKFKVPTFPLPNVSLLPVRPAFSHRYTPTS